ncbi:MAG: serine dehydratase subunit alpha family protein [Solobacterium sp.]|nr:serine dehydratase subunit alpha family protein [Solobacterium sp.]
MNRNDKVYQTYLEILRRELISAMGCTEPIALAYCAASARSALGCLPEKIKVEASGNIIKNVKSVVVPNTGQRRGIAAAACIGVLAGDETAGLEVISHVSEEDKERLGTYMEQTEIEVKPLTSDYLLDMIVTVSVGDSYVKVRIANEHTNIILIEKNGEVLLQKDGDITSEEKDVPDYSLLSVSGIYDFACTCDLADVKEILDRQISQNTAISEAGMNKDYGANIGKVLLKTGNDLKTHAKAYAAAGSDARMNGCELPVVICSGSGNQGLTASLPVITYAKGLNASEEQLYRALLISNLITLHLKAGIGRLSAYCGAVSAGAGAGAAIAYLHGGDEEVVAHSLVNALAITSGIVCDGAKSSCAAKIATAVDTGIFGFEMYQNGQQFYGGDGLVVKGVENSVANFARLARVGMRETDLEIIRMMTEESGNAS